MSEFELKEFILGNFDKYDISGDGYLGKEELATFFRDILERKRLHDQHDPEELAVKFIGMIDGNGDGRLSREEIYHFYKEK